MSESDRGQSHFTGVAEMPELEEYRPINPLVIAACLAGLLSLLAVFHPLLWVLPVAAIIISLAAIVRVSTGQRRSSGRNAAIFALCVAVFAGAYAPARAISRERTLLSAARAKAEAWLALIQQGRVQEAHQLTMQPELRFQGPGSLASHYEIAPPKPSPVDPMEDAMMEMSGEPTPPERLRTFVTEVAKLLEFGEQARFEHLEDVSTKSEHGDLVFTQRYRATRIHQGQTESIEFYVRATRHDGERVAEWRVGSLELLQ